MIFDVMPDHSVEFEGVQNLETPCEPARGLRVRCPRGHSTHISLEPCMTGRIALPILIVAALLALAARMPQATAQAVGPDEAHAAICAQSGAEARHLRCRFPSAI